MVIWAVLLMAAVLFISRSLFRGRALGTRLRIVLSLVAVGLLAASFVRDGGLGIGRIVILVLTTVVLVAGIAFLSIRDGRSVGEDDKFSG